MSSEDSKKKKDRQGYFLIVFSVVVIVGFLAFSSLGRHSSRDATTLCLQEGPAGAVAILTDLTDQLEEVQLLSVSNELGVGEVVDGGILSKIPANFEVRSFSIPQILEERRTFKRGICNPGDGSNLSSLYANPELAKKKWEKSFLQPLKRELNRTLSIEESSNNSPILEAIQLVSVSFLSRPDLRGKPKRLIIISDLLQNTENISHLRGDVQYEVFRKSSEYVHLKTNLKGVEVSVLYLWRRGFSNIQGRKHADFWKKYFNDMGATISNQIGIKSIEG